VQASPSPASASPAPDDSAAPSLDIAVNRHSLKDVAALIPLRFGKVNLNEPSPARITIKKKSKAGKAFLARLDELRGSLDDAFSLMSLGAGNGAYYGVGAHGVSGIPASEIYWLLMPALGSTLNPAWYTPDVVDCREILRRSQPGDTEEWIYFDDDIAWQILGNRNEEILAKLP
jgi:hypothetical protein